MTTHFPGLQANAKQIVEEEEEQDPLQLGSIGDHHGPLKEGS